MAVIDYALSQTNYAEGDDNDTVFGKWYGMNHQPWCAMFVSWCFGQSGEVAKVAASTKKGFASCDAGLKWFAKKGKLITLGEAQRGDIVFFQFDADAEPDHVGLVLSNSKLTQSLVCIEGNTSPDSKGSQSNGGGGIP